MQNHIATHLQRIALFALPRSTDLEDGSTEGNGFSQDANAEIQDSYQGDLESIIQPDGDDARSLQGESTNHLTIESLQRIINTPENAVIESRTNEYILNLETEYNPDDSQFSKADKTNSMIQMEHLFHHCLEILKALPADDPNRADFLTQLGLVFSVRYEKTGQFFNLDQFIQYYQQALENMLANRPKREEWLNSLEKELNSRYERTGAMVNLEQSIKYGYQALEATPADHPDWKILLMTLDFALWARYQRTGAMAHLEQCIKYQQQTLEARPVNDPHRRYNLRILERSFRQRYSRTGQMADLEQANRYEQALKLYNEQLANPTDPTEDSTEDPHKKAS